ncbi:MAG: hypothetical protein GX234_10745 [Clostridiales bacterium]|nr:hypothetical protein [Clostridiales bacterium]
MGTESIEWMLQEYGLQDWQRGLEELFPQWNLSFEDILKALFTGNLQECFLLLKEGVADQFFMEISSFKSIFISLLLIGILSALLSNLAEIFKSRQIADISFYFAYLLIVILLLQIFEQSAATMSRLIEQIVLFMKLFLPTYFLVLGAASGGVTAGITYQMLLVLIYLIQAAISVFVIPAVYVYVFLNMINGLWMEERLVLMMEALKKGIQFLLKAVMTAVMGISLIQSMITPVIDSLRGAAVQKAVNVIPGLGNLAGGCHRDADWFCSLSEKQHWNIYVDFTGCTLSDSADKASCHDRAAKRSGSSHGIDCGQAYDLVY